MHLCGEVIIIYMCHFPDRFDYMLINVGHTLQVLLNRVYPADTLACCVAPWTLEMNKLT